MRHIIKIKVSAKKKPLNKSKNKQTNNRKKKQTNKNVVIKIRHFFVYRLKKISNFIEIVFL